MVLLRDVQTATSGASGDEVYDVPNPASEPGDLVVVFFEITDNGVEGNFGSTVVAPLEAGWEASAQYSSAWVLVAGFARFATADDPAVWQFRLSAGEQEGLSGYPSAVAIAVEGATSVTWNTARQSSGTSIPTNSIDLLAGELLFWFAGGRTTSSGHAVSPPSGMTEVADVFSLNQQGTWAAGAYEEGVAAGSVSRTGTRTDSNESIALLAAIGLRRSGFVIGRVGIGVGRGVS